MMDFTPTLTSCRLLLKTSEGMAHRHRAFGVHQVGHAFSEQVRGVASTHGGKSRFSSLDEAARALLHVLLSREGRAALGAIGVGVRQRIRAKVPMALKIYLDGYSIRPPSSYREHPFTRCVLAMEARERDGRLYPQIVTFYPEAPLE